MWHSLFVIILFPGSVRPAFSLLFLSTHCYSSSSSWPLLPYNVLYSSWSMLRLPAARFHSPIVYRPWSLSPPPRITPSLTTASVIILSLPLSHSSLPSAALFSLHWNRLLMMFLPSDPWSLSTSCYSVRGFSLHPDNVRYHPYKRKPTLSYP